MPPKKTKTPPTVVEMSKVINEFVYELKPEEEETKIPHTNDDVKKQKAAIRKQKAAETRALNKKFEDELDRLNNPQRAWKFGDPIDLSTAIDVPSDEVKIILSRIKVYDV